MNKIYRIQTLMFFEVEEDGQLIATCGTKDAAEKLIKRLKAGDHEQAFKLDLLQNTEELNA